MKTLIEFDRLCRCYNDLDARFSCRSGEFTLKDVLPEAFCPLIFHSIYAYILTQVQGGWFNWVGFDEQVIVNCPSPEGIAVHVSRPSEKHPDRCDIPVIRKKKLCYKGYKEKDMITFPCDEESMRRYKIIDRFIPFLGRAGRHETELTCSVDGEEVTCRMKGAP